MKSLIIAEKPSVARDIGKVLNCNKKGNGYLYNEKYIISWAIGHLVTLCDPEEYDENLKKWKMDTLPIIPDNIKIKAIKNTKEQLKIIHNLMKMNEVENLICATDSGREGELIFRYIYNITNCKKPFKRLWISSMTDEAIKDGFENLKDGTEYDNLYNCAKCRSEADWLVGINASRAFTLKFNTLLSIGRVQTPTLAILVERYKEIQNFNIKDYFEIEVEFEKISDLKENYKGIWINLKENETKIYDKEKAQNIAKEIKGKNGIIFSVENETKKQPPPLLYDLTELQRDCNKKYGYSAQKTLSLAQDLYEKRKLITYPRTDSRYLSEDMKSKISGILKNLNSIDEYAPFLNYVFSLENLPITKRIIDNSKITDHHAIIPTNKSVNLSSLSNDEKNIYNLIARRFIAVFYPNYVYSTTKIISKIENHYFITKGTSIIDKGWTILNINTEKKSEDILPNVKKDDQISVIKNKVVNKKTKPPSHYNEATLLSAMENAGRFVESEDLKEQLKESGLGTPATRASIIERLIKVGYIERKGKNLIATSKGIQLIEIVPKELKSPETTGKWEKGLSSISKGNMQTHKFMESINRYVNFIVDYAKNSNVSVIFEDENFKKSPKYKSMNKFGKCFKCGGDILENSKSFYCSNWKSGCKFSIWKNHLEGIGIILTGDLIKKLLKDKKIENFEIKKENTIIKGNILFTESGNIIFERI